MHHQVEFKSKHITLVLLTLQPVQLGDVGMLGGTMAIDWGPSREVLWWFETDYVVKISTFCHTGGFSGTTIITLDDIICERVQKRWIA